MSMGLLLRTLWDISEEQGRPVVQWFKMTLNMSKENVKNHRQYSETSHLILSSTNIEMCAMYQNMSNKCTLWFCVVENY